MAGLALDILLGGTRAAIILIAGLCGLDLLKAVPCDQEDRGTDWIY